jgi:thiamine-monophosphate kinase
MNLSELGEFGLIDLIHSITEKLKDPDHPSWQRVLLGIGDDTAAWQSNEQTQLATTDTLVQNVHFDLKDVTWEELGWKALAINLSDIAAMGGIPQYALVSLALPGELEVENISRLYQGMAYLAKEFGVAIVGGNIAAAPNVVITVALLGSAKDEKMLKRSSAMPGEEVAVTGQLGLSAACLMMLKEEISLDAETTRILRKGHFQPMPKVKEGQILLEQGVKTAIDISDGLIADLGHICEASKVSAQLRIDQVPVHPLVKANFHNYQQLALCGGEDYELLFTASKAAIEQVRHAIDYPVTMIGNIMEERLPNRVTLLDAEGNIAGYEKGGWEHFRDGAFKAQIT